MEWWCSPWRHSQLLCLDWNQLLRNKQESDLVQWAEPAQQLHFQIERQESLLDGWTGFPFQNEEEVNSAVLLEQHRNVWRDQWLFLLEECEEIAQFPMVSDSQEEVIAYQYWDI